MSDIKNGCLSLLSTTTIASFATTATDFTLFTVPVGSSCILSEAFVECDADVGAALAFTIGQVAGATDFIGATNGDNLDADNDVIRVVPVPTTTPATLKKYAAGTVIELDITVAGNAVAGTVYLFGFLI